MENKPESLLVVPLGKNTQWDSPILVRYTDGRATPRQVRYSALIAFCDRRINMQLSTIQSKLAELNW